MHCKMTNYTQLTFGGLMSLPYTDAFEELLVYTKK